MSSSNTDCCEPSCKDFQCQAGRMSRFKPGLNNLPGQDSQHARCTSPGFARRPSAETTPDTGAEACCEFGTQQWQHVAIRCRLQVFGSLSRGRFWTHGPLGISPNQSYQFRTFVALLVCLFLSLHSKPETRFPEFAAAPAALSCA